MLLSETCHTPALRWHTAKQSISTSVGSCADGWLALEPPLKLRIAYTVVQDANSDQEVAAVHQSTSAQQPTTHPQLQPTQMADPQTATMDVTESDTERNFSFTLDIRAFHANAKLPLNMASVYALLHLPQELISFLAGQGVRVPPRFTPLKTYPAMDVARGSEGALPNGYATAHCLT